MIYETNELKPQQSKLWKNSQGKLGFLNESNKEYLARGTFYEHFPLSVHLFIRKRE